MVLQSLTLCNDEEILRQVRIILHDLGIGLRVCSHPEQAIEEFRRHKFELIVLDTELAPDKVLAGLRESHSNRTTVACAIGRSSGRESAYDLVIPRPFTIEQAWRTLREARGRLEEEQQRYYRERIRLRVAVRGQDGSCIEAQGCNLSVSGMAVTAGLLPGRVVISFALDNNAMELDGEVTWTTEQRSGVHFLNLPELAKQRLESWIAERRHEREFSFVKPFPEDLDMYLPPLASI